MAKFGDGGDLLKCSFCGKSQKQVKKLIAGPGVYICDECIDLCNEIIEEELSETSELKFDELPKPREIYEFLNDYVIGQEEAKKVLSVAVYDTMQYIKPDVVTICMGQAASAAAVLLAAGTKGKRFGLPHSRILIHQPSGGAEGQSVDIEIQAREILRMRRMLDEILATHTGQSVEKVSRDTDRDFIMTAEEAKAYGLIDDIIESRQSADELVAAAANGGR